MYKTCCVGADGCGGGGQPAACCEKNTIQLRNDIRWSDAKSYETIAYKYVVPFVVLDSGCSMKSHLTLNLNDGTVFLATVSTIASELSGSLMLNSTEMFFTLLLNPFSKSWLNRLRLTNRLHWE